MASTALFEDELLKLIFHGDPIDKIADNATATPTTEYFVSLHTDDPAKSPTPSQSAGNEVAYTGYARQAVSRTPAGWTVNNGKAAATEVVEFAVVSGVTGTPRIAAFFGVGSMLTGVGVLMFSGKLVPPINIANGIEPRIDNASTASRMEDTWAS